jgi:predicted amidohydrolase
MRVAVVQHDIVWEDPAATCLAVTPMIEAAVAGGARLVLLSEMFATGFSMDAERIAESADGPSTAFLVDTAKRLGAWIGGSVPLRAESSDGLPTNTFTLAAPNGTVVRYNKRHPFSYGREHEHYAAGDELVLVDIEGLRLALFVCYDLRFADDFWMLAPDVHGYLVVANWPAARAAHWRALLVARAIENQAYVVACNRVGTDGNGLAYDGDSVILDPLGRALAAASIGPTVITADITADDVAAVRARFPFLADRR